MSMKKVLLSLTASAFLLSACGGAEETEQEETTEPDTEEVADSDPEDLEEAEEENTEDVEGTEEIEPEESNEGETEETELGTLTTHSQVLDIGETQESGPFNITLLNASLADLVVSDEFAEWFDTPEVVVVAMEIDVENTTGDTNAIYPDQGTIVTNTGKQVDADLLMSDDVGGDFLGEVTKSGTVFFFFEEDPAAIENVRYVIGGGFTENFESLGEDLEFSVDF